MVDHKYKLLLELFRLQELEEEEHYKGGNELSWMRSLSKEKVVPLL